MGNTLTAFALLNEMVGNTLAVHATLSFSSKAPSVWLSPSALSAYIALGVLLSLVIGWVYKFCAKPKLRASMNNESPDAHGSITNSRQIQVGRDPAGNRIELPSDTPYESRYFRIKITNVGWLSKIIGKRPAKNVEIYGMNIYKESNGWFEKVGDFLPRNFNWSYMEEKNNMIYQQLTHLSSRHCDIFYIVKDNKYLEDMKFDKAFAVRQIDAGKSPMLLLTPVLSNHFDWVLGPGRYLFHVSVSSDESKPRYIEIKINHKGTWDLQKNRPNTHIEYCGEIQSKRTTEKRIEIK